MATQAPAVLRFTSVVLVNILHLKCISAACSLTAAVIDFC